MEFKIAVRFHPSSSNDDACDFPQKRSFYIFVPSDHAVHPFPSNMLSSYEKLLIRVSTLCFCWMPPIPIKWNIFESRATYQVSKKLQTSMWLLTTLFAFIFSLACIFSVTIKQAFNLPQNLAINCLQFYIGCHGTMVFLYFIILSSAGSEPLNGLNEMITFHNSLLTQSYKEAKEVLSLLDLVVLTTSPYGSTFAPVLVIGLLYFHLDPLYPIFGGKHNASILIRLVVSFSMVESIHLFCVTFATLHIWLRKYEKILNFLLVTDDILKNVFLSKRVRLVVNFVMATIEKLCSVTLTNISFLLILMFWVGVKGYKTIHPLVHLIVTATAIAHAVGLVLFLYKLSSLGSKSKENLARIRVKAKKVKNGWTKSYFKKYLMRQTVSIAPIYFWYRPFMAITMETSLAVYMFVSVRIADALIVWE